MSPIEVVHSLPTGAAVATVAAEGRDLGSPVRAPRPAGVGSVHQTAGATKRLMGFASDKPGVSERAMSFWARRVT
jgi:hypothetical protein